MDTESLIYIEPIYRQHSNNFFETLSFLDDIQLVDLTPSQTCRLKVDFNGEEDLKEKVVKELHSSTGEANKYLGVFISKFDYIEGKYCWEPNLSDRLNYSGFRNLLMDLEVIAYLKDEDSYFINEKYEFLFSGSFSERALSQEALEARLASQKKLGLEVEKQVLNFEINRLEGINLPSPIKWISQENASAGFDIKSYSHENGILIDRFIEVKAVSVDNYEFFWSANEIEASKRYRSHYHLYIAPVGASMSLMIDKLLIISNPFQSIFSSKQWEFQCQVMKFNLKKILES
jgi:hypothetical protein